MISRQAIRENIRELGNQLGEELFVAHSRGVEPTAKAIEIYPIVKGALDTLASIEKAKATESLKIAVANSSAEVIIVAYLKEFYQKYPHIKLDVQKREGMSIPQQMAMDFVVDHEFAIDKKDFKAIEFITMTGSFVASRDFIKKHNIKPPIALDDLFKFPIVSREEAFKDFLQNNKTVNKPHLIAVASMDMALPMTEDSIGIGYFAGELLGIKRSTNLVVLDVKDAKTTTFKYLCAYKNALTQPAKAFISGLLEFVKV